MHTALHNTNTTMKNIKGLNKSHNIENCKIENDMFSMYKSKNTYTLKIMINL